MRSKLLQPKFIVNWNFYLKQALSAFVKLQAGQVSPKPAHPRLGCTGALRCGPSFARPFAMVLQLFYSALAVAALVFVAFALGFRHAPRLDQDAAIGEAEAALPGFRASVVALARDGRGAVLRDHDGGLAIVLPLGDGWVARRVPVNAPVSLLGTQMVVKLGEPMLARAELSFAAPLPGWVLARAR